VNNCKKNQVITQNHHLKFAKFHHAEDGGCVTKI